MYYKVKYIILLFLFFSCQKKRVVEVGDTILLIYKIKDIYGCRIDESFFHSNWNVVGNDDQVLTFVVGRGEVIKGWDSVIVGCKENKLYTFKIPYQQAYGDEQIYHDIPPKSDLILTFKIIDIIKNEN